MPGNLTTRLLERLNRRQLLEVFIETCEQTADDENETDIEDQLEVIFDRLTSLMSKGKALYLIHEAVEERTNQFRNGA